MIKPVPTAVRQHLLRAVMVRNEFSMQVAASDFFTQELHEGLHFVRHIAP